MTTENVRLTRVVLGAGDPEMAACARVARVVGLEVVQAMAINTTATPVPVSPFTAYKAVFPDPQPGDIWVECAPDGGGKAALQMRGIRLCDHHQSGDPGYGAGPSSAIRASSLGQLAALLGVELDSAECVIAAADHCLAAAFAGLVPGVAPEDVLKSRIAAAAAFERRLEDDIRTEILSALETLRNAPKISLGGVEVADLRGFLPPEIPPERADIGGVPGLQHAGPMTGQVYIACVRESRGRGGGIKIVIGGAGAGTAAGTAPIDHFMGSWAADNGLTKMYGDAARGFAGAYPVTT